MLRQPPRDAGREGTLADLPRATAQTTQALGGGDASTLSRPVEEPFLRSPAQRRFLRGECGALGSVEARPCSRVSNWVSCWSALAVRANVVRASAGLKRWREMALA